MIISNVYKYTESFPKSRTYFTSEFINNIYIDCTPYFMNINQIFVIDGLLNYANWQNISADN